MPMWTQEATYSLTESNSNTTREWFFQHMEDPSIAYKLQFLRNGYSTLYHLRSIYEGTARPAWYPSGVADALQGGLTRSSSAPNNRYYYSLSDNDRRADWNVPAAGAGMDSIVVYFTGLDGGGEIEVVKNPGASEVSLGYIDTQNATTNYTLSGSITGFDPLVAGDVIAFRRKTDDATARVQSFYCYDSDGVVSDYDGIYCIPSQTLTSAAGMTNEMAYQLAATGGAVRFIGGYEHQGNAVGNCTEVNGTEDWTRNGSAWTHAKGWVTGTVVCHRTSDVDYDQGGNILGSLDYSYTLTPTGYAVSHTFTAAAALDTGVCYPCMTSAGTNFTTAFVRCGSYWQAIDVTADDDSHADVNTTYVHAVKGVYYSATPLGALWDVLILSHSHPWALYDKNYAAAFIVRGKTNRKFYVNINPTIVEGTVISASWRSRFTNILNKRQQAHQLLTP